MSLREIFLLSKLFRVWEGPAWSHCCKDLLRLNPQPWPMSSSYKRSTSLSLTHSISQTHSLSLSLSHSLSLSLTLSLSLSYIHSQNIFLHSLSHFLSLNVFNSLSLFLSHTTYFIFFISLLPLLSPSVLYFYLSSFILSTFLCARVYVCVIERER